MAEIKEIKVGSTTYDLHATTANIAYATCSTAAATAAKVINVVDNSNWELVTGAIVIVLFSATNTAQNPTFNVNGTGAKNVYYGASQITTSSLDMAGYANRPTIYIYDGTQYRFAGWGADNNTTYTNVKLGHGYCTCSTAVGTAAKTASLSSYTLTTGGIVAVRFTNGNTASKPTLNINSKGAKSIYYNGAALTDTSLIKAGDVVTFIYSSQYHIIAINRDTDTVYTHPTYTAITGKPTGNQTPTFGGTATVSQITSDTTGHVTGATDRTITIPSTLSNGTGTAGLIKTSSTVTSSSGYTACPVISGVPYYKDTNTTYTFNGAVSTIKDDNLTASRALISNSSGKVAVSDVTSTELGYLDGVTSNIQTQLNAKAASGHTHSGMATVYTGTIGTSWTEDSDTGVKTQTVTISGITANHTAKVDHYYNGDGTSEGYSTFVTEENQYLDCITNGFAETVANGIKFTIFGDAPTVSIPIVVEVC